MILDLYDVDIYKMSIECQECKKELNKINGQYVCTECGLINNDIIVDEIDYPDNRQEQNNPFSNELSTFMSKGNMSYILKDSKYIKFDIYKLHVQTNYNNKQRSYSDVSNIIDSCIIPEKVKNTAKKIWTDFIGTKKIIKGLMRKGIISCILYYSHIEHNIPIEISEICDLIYKIDTKYFNKANKEFITIFNNSKWSHLLTKRIEAVDYFNYYIHRIIDITSRANDTRSYSEYDETYAPKCQSIINECLKLYNDNEYRFLNLGLTSTKNICISIIYIVIIKYMCITKTFVSEKTSITFPNSYFITINQLLGQ